MKKSQEKDLPKASLTHIISIIWRCLHIFLSCWQLFSQMAEMKEVLVKQLNQGAHFQARDEVGQSVPSSYLTNIEQGHTIIWFEVRLNHFSPVDHILLYKGGRCGGSSDMDDCASKWEGRCGKGVNRVYATSLGTRFLFDCGWECMSNISHSKRECARKRVCNVRSREKEIHHK